MHTLRMLPIKDRPRAYLLEATGTELPSRMLKRALYAQALFVFFAEMTVKERL